MQPPPHRAAASVARGRRGSGGWRGSCPRRMCSGAAAGRTWCTGVASRGVELCERAVTSMCGPSLSLASVVHTHIHVWPWLVSCICCTHSHPCVALACLLHLLYTHWQTVAGLGHMWRILCDVGGACATSFASIQACLADRPAPKPGRLKWQAGRQPRKLAGW